MRETTTIKIPKWLAKKNNLPMIADVYIEAVRGKVVFVSGSGKVDSPVNCMICARDLTHPVSRFVGIGPICSERIGIPWEVSEDEDEVERLREKLRRHTKFEFVSLPISQITFEDESVLEEIKSQQPKPFDFKEGQMVKIEVSDWIRDQKFFQENEFDGRVKAVTEKAVRVQNGNTEIDEWWPKSQILSTVLLDDGKTESVVEKYEEMTGMTFSDFMEVNSPYTVETY